MLTTANLLSNEERGSAASGIAVIQANGDCRLFKRPLPASELVQKPGYLNTLASISQDTVCILAHTRYPTKGSCQFSSNNHPIVANHVIGIHNGHIDNDDALFIEDRLPRTGEVDSEVIFRLQDTINPFTDSDIYCTRLQRLADRLSGGYITLSVDLRRPARLWVLKQTRPLCLHYEPTVGTLFFSSRYIFLRKAFGQIVSQETLESGYGYCFDADRLQQLGGQPGGRFSLTSVDRPLLPALELG